MAGFTTVAVILGIVAAAAIMFQGKLEDTVPVTVLSPRAGLVMNPDAKVELLGVQVGKVASIESLPDGQAALHLALDKAALQQIPANVMVDIASSTVFGAKFVQFTPPPNPVPADLAAGTVLDAGHVTVEINTVFEQLTRVLAEVDPAKLNETLGALASAFDGRGQKVGDSLADLNKFLGTLEPSLANLNHDLEVAPAVLNSYADAAQDLVDTADNATKISETVVDQQSNLDAFLVSAIGLGGIGNDVLATNTQPLADVLNLLVPTTALTNEYNPAITCGLQGFVHIQKDSPPLELPGVVDSVGLLMARERYRYPGNLPKVAATGGPHCADMHMPNVPANTSPPFLVLNDGADPTQYGNQGILLNSDGLKQWLFGPLDGPPRNSTQFGQPG